MIQFNAQKTLQSTTGKMVMDVSFTLEKGSFLSIYGKSGAGKTTVLKLLAGLVEAEKSEITVAGTTWNSTQNKICIPVQKRSVGFVFQDFALFPNFTVEENLRYALPINKDAVIVDEVLELMELQLLKNSKPHQLSGGQQQRVALARAIVRKPEILLLDEPLSALDDEMRLKLQDYIALVHRHFNFTTILVSHNLSEIFKLSDRVIMLDEGKILKEGIPGNVFNEQKLSSKFKLTGEIIEIKKSDIIYIVSVLTGNNIIKVVATDDEIKNLSVGQKIMVASKAFNPIITIL